MRLLAAPDKMRGTLDAPDFAAAIAGGASAAGWESIEIPLSDGGEGFADAMGGAPHRIDVTGPLGGHVSAPIHLLGDGGTAVIEMADAAGRALLPDPRGDEPVAATTRGVGELISAAIDLGAERVIVGCGGSATTDGGRGAVDAIEESGGLRGAELIVATDVATRFVDAATRFAPQKGATPLQVDALRKHLIDTADYYRDRYGVDVTEIDRAGAAGGLAGGLAALGGSLRSGFELVAAATGLGGALCQVDLLVSGEGRLDRSTLEGKTLASLLDLAPADLGVLIVVGELEPEAVEALTARRPGATTVCSLSERFGRERSMHDTAGAVTQVVTEFLQR